MMHAAAAAARSTPSTGVAVRALATSVSPVASFSLSSSSIPLTGAWATATAPASCQSPLSSSATPAASFPSSSSSLTAHAARRSPYLLSARFARKPKLPTQVILSEDVAGLGGAGEQVAVKAGRARNFLVPRGMAVYPPAPLRMRTDPVLRVSKDAALAADTEDVVARAERRAHREHVSRMAAIELEFQRPAPRKQLSTTSPVTVNEIVTVLQEQHWLYDVRPRYVQLPGGAMGRGRHQPPLAAYGAHTVYVRVVDAATFQADAADDDECDLGDWQKQRDGAAASAEAEPATASAAAAEVSGLEKMLTTEIEPDADDAAATASTSSAGEGSQQQHLTSLEELRQQYGEDGVVPITVRVVRHGRKRPYIVHR